MLEIADSLKEVRKAYRLIFDFQSRVLDLMSFIKGKLDFEYEGGYVKYSNQSPRNGSGGLKQWSWDWLNLYFYEFHFKSKIVNSDKINFSVFLLCDSGYFESKKENTLSKLNIDKYKDPNESVTKLIFVAAKNSWSHFSEENWNNTFFTLSEHGQKVDEKGIMIFKSYNLEKFADEISATSVLKDFVEYANSHDIPLEIIERNFV